MKARAQAVLPAIMDIGLGRDVGPDHWLPRLYLKCKVDPKVTRAGLAAIGGKFSDRSQHNILRMLAPALTVSNSEVGQGALAILGGVYDGFCSGHLAMAFSGRDALQVSCRQQTHVDRWRNAYALLSDETRHQARCRKHGRRSVTWFKGRL